MVKARGISTVLGAVISIAAMLAVMAAAAYMLGTIGSTEARIAKLSSQRMNELLEMYTSLVVNNTGTRVCFYAPGDKGLVKSVILLYGHSVSVVHGRCVKLERVRFAKRIILASRSGALFQLDPRIVTSVNGSAPLHALLTGTSLSRSAGGWSGVGLDSIVGQFNTTMFARDARVTNLRLNVSINLYNSIGYPVAEERLGISVGSATASTSTTTLQWFADNYQRIGKILGWPRNIVLLHVVYGDYRRLAQEHPKLSLLGGYSRRSLTPADIQPPLAVRFVKVGRDTVCGVTMFTDVPWLFPDYIIRVIGVTVCFRRLVLNGSSVVVNSTLLWGGTPLARELLRLVQKQGYAIIRAGPPGGLVPGYTSREDSGGLAWALNPLGVNSYGARYDLLNLNIDIVTKPFVEGDTINLAPMVYQPIVDKVYYVVRERYGPRTESVDIASDFESTGRVVDGLLRPYVWSIWTPIALYYNMLYDGNRIPQFLILYGVPPSKLRAASLYQPGFVTYVEPAPGTHCRLVHLDYQPPLVNLKGVVREPGLICVKIGTYQARVEVFDAYDTHYFLKHDEPKIVYRYTIPEDLIACYYPAKLVCDGPVYIYYSFFPSILFNPKYLQLLNNLYRRMALDKDRHPELVNTFMVSLGGRDMQVFFYQLSRQKRLKVCNLEVLFEHIYGTYSGPRVDRRVAAPSEDCRLILPGVAVLVNYMHISASIYYVHKPDEVRKALTASMLLPLRYIGGG